jgi:hypothetical protein
VAWVMATVTAGSAKDYARWEWLTGWGACDGQLPPQSGAASVARPRRSWPGTRRPAPLARPRGRPGAHRRTRQRTPVATCMQAGMLTRCPSSYDRKAVCISSFTCALCSEGRFSKARRKGVLDSQTCCQNSAGAPGQGNVPRPHRPSQLPDPA